MTEVMNRLGDRVNPIVIKEMRQAVNSRFVSGMLVLFLSVELVVTAMMLLNRSAVDDGGQDMRTGREVFRVLQAILMVTCILLIPVLTAGRLAGERSDVNVDLLFISSLSPLQIVLGKLLAAIALALLVFSACTPFMTFAYLLRGVDIPTIAVVLLFDFLAVVYATMFALLVAAVPANRGLRILLSVFAVIALVYVTIGAVRAGISFLEFEFQSDVGTWDFWLGFAGICAAIVAVIGLMLVWATALISPPTSNRAFSVRLYTLGLFLFGEAAFLVWAKKIERAEPLYVCGLVFSLLFAFQWVIACSERDEWGPRVLRRVPRSRGLRALAFVFYSGAAGGFIFGLLGCIASLASIYLPEVLGIVRHSRFIDDDDYLLVASLLAAYTYCYTMSAVVVRRMLRGTSFKSSATWLLGLILFGLGSLLPYLLDAILFPRYRGSAYGPDTMWLFLPSTVIMVEQAVRTENYLYLTWPFLGIWAATVTAINLPWIGGQMRKFRPLTRVSELEETVDHADEQASQGFTLGYERTPLRG